jgi:ubiquinone/menaquinone biosynthesis C-methylase UbiE
LARLGLSLTKQSVITGPEREQQDHFDWYAKNSKQDYDSYASSSFWKSVDTYVFSLWRPLIKKNSLFLDIGCGQGRSTFQVSNMPIRIVAFDISKEMIRLAIKKYQSGHYQADITFLVADATSMPFKNHCFDSVMSYGVLHHLRNAAASCKEVARILKFHNGTFFCLENNKSMFRTLFDIMQYVRPIWYEKAGSSPLLSEKDLQRWFKGTRVKILCRTMTYLPPHVAVLLPLGIVKKLLYSTDKLFTQIPWLNKQGGLIVGIGTT